MAFLRQEWRDDDLGTLGWLDSGKRISGFLDELVQPLLVWLGRRLALLRRGRDRARREPSRIQAFHPPAAIHTSAQLRPGHARFALWFDCLPLAHREGLGFL